MKHLIYLLVFSLCCGFFPSGGYRHIVGVTPETFKELPVSTHIWRGPDYQGNYHLYGEDIATAAEASYQRYYNAFGRDYSGDRTISPKISHTHLSYMTHALEDAVESKKYLINYPNISNGKIDVEWFNPFNPREESPLYPHALSEIMDKLGCPRYTKLESLISEDTIGRLSRRDGYLGPFPLLYGDIRSVFSALYRLQYFFLPATIYPPSYSRIDLASNGMTITNQHYTYNEKHPIVYLNCARLKTTAFTDGMNSPAIDKSCHFQQRANYVNDGYPLISKYATRKNIYTLYGVIRYRNYWNGNQPAVEKGCYLQVGSDLPDIATVLSCVGIKDDVSLPTEEVKELGWSTEREDYTVIYILNRWSINSVGSYLPYWYSEWQ